MKCVFCKTDIEVRHVVEACDSLTRESDIEEDGFETQMDCPNCGKLIYVGVDCEVQIERYVGEVRAVLSEPDKKYLEWKAEQEGVDIAILTKQHIASMAERQSA